MSGPARRRTAAALALAATVIAGLAVVGILPDSAATDIAGDALYAVAVYAGLVLLFARTKSLPLAVATASWCIAVELLQLTGAPRALADALPPARLVLGTGFDVRDLVVYCAAVAVTYGVDIAMRRRAGMSRGDGGLEPI